MLYLNHLKKPEQAKPTTSRRREIIKIRAEIKTKKNKESMKQNTGSLKRNNFGNSD
jgi:hypothetical protein